MLHHKSTFGRFNESASVVRFNIQIHYSFHYYSDSYPTWAGSKITQDISDKCKSIYFLKICIEVKKGSKMTILCHVNLGDDNETGEEFSFVVARDIGAQRQPK